MALLESHLFEQSNLSIFTVLQHRNDVDFNLENLSHFMAFYDFSNQLAKKLREKVECLWSATGEKENRVFECFYCARVAVIRPLM
jgi:hypothetical protein